MSPAEVAWEVASFQATQIKGNALRLLVYLLGRAIASDSLLVKVGRKRAMRDLHIWRSGFDSARVEISSHVPVTSPQKGRPREYDLRGIWCAELRKRGLLPDHVLAFQGGLKPSHVSFLGAPPGGSIPGHVPEQGGSIPGHVGFPQGGSIPGHVPEQGGSIPGHVGFPQGGSIPGHVPEQGGSIPGHVGGISPIPESSHVLPKGGSISGHVGANKHRTVGRDLNQIDRSINQSTPEAGDERREPNAAEVEAARGWLRTLRYQDGHGVDASAEACVFALKAAGSVERLQWAIAKLSARVKTNAQWRPRGAKTLRPWLRKVIAAELQKIDGEDPEPEPVAVLAPEPAGEVAQMPRNGERERVDTSAMVAGLAGVKRLR